jgi:hypothetical protein
MSLMYISLLVHSIEQSTFFLSSMSVLSSDIRQGLEHPAVCLVTLLSHNPYRCPTDRIWQPVVHKEQYWPNRLRRYMRGQNATVQ